MNEDVAQHFVILYYFRDGSYWWSCCETRPIFNLVDTRCNRIVTAWRPFGTFHQQRFCYSVSVAWDHPLQSARLDIIGLSLCHQIYPLDPLPFYPFLSFSFGLLVCSSRAGAESLCPWCGGAGILHWALWAGSLPQTIASQIRSVCILKCADRSNCPPLDIPSIRSLQLCSAATSSVLWWDHSADRDQLHFSVQNTTLHPVLDEENRRVYMDNLLSLMDKLHICIARSFHRGIVSCTMHKTVISAVERLMVSNEILLQCVTMGTSVSLHSLHALQLSALPASIFTRPKPKLRSLNGLTKMLLLSTANARNGYLTENHKSCDIFQQTCKV